MDELFDPNDDLDSESSTTIGDNREEYISIPSKLKCTQVLASYQADVPPIYRAKKNADLYSRGALKQNKIAQIQALTTRPRSVVPPGALNTWRNVTPDTKLPDLRHKAQGKIYYTRGQLCKKLNKDKPEFDLSDPLNKRKILDNQRYSALHDPHCKSYFKQSGVVNHLKKQQLINDRGEVLCDIHEFNQYRSYLGELFNDQVKRRIDDSEGMKDLERNLSKSMSARQKKHQLDEHKNYQLHHMKMNTAFREAKRQKYISSIKLWGKRLVEIEAHRSQNQLTRMGMHTIKHWNAYMTRQKANDADAQRKKNTLSRIAYAEIKNDYVTKYDKFVRLALFERYKADKCAELVARDDQINDMELLVEETLKRSRSIWLKNYDSFIATCRDNPVSQYKAQLEFEARQKYLKRKYFNLWLKFIVKRRKEKPDEDHTSLFNIDNHIKPFVENMKDISASDLEPDNHKESDDVNHKKKKRNKIADLVKVFPDLDKRVVSNHHTSNHHTSNHHKCNENDENHGEDSHHKKANPNKQGDGDGHEADVDEADEYIDKVVARYKLEQEVLKEKLRRKSPTIHSRRTIASMMHAHEEDKDNIQLDDDQEEQIELINTLQDVNDVQKGKGWKTLRF